MTSENRVWQTIGDQGNTARQMTLIDRLKCLVGRHGWQFLRVVPSGDGVLLTYQCYRCGETSPHSSSQEA